jgi:uncharacterized repeat protein (TIGR03803 family)
VLHRFLFTAADGQEPTAGLVFDAAGNLYGTTASGGGGIVFKLAPNPDGTWTENVLHSFTRNSADGDIPRAGLIFDSSGNLYGTTASGGGSSACIVGGGAEGCGVVFKLAPNPDGTWTESILYSFTGGADGAGPQAGLIFDAAGNLYGTTYSGGSTACTGGCGVVFKLTPTGSSWSERVLHSFGGHGEFPNGPVIFDPAGNLFGTTSAGSSNFGLVFEITP